MACPICGGDCKDYTPAPGAGITVTRLRETRSDMSKKVTLSVHRIYVTKDKRTAVREGDERAAFLLVGKGAAIAPEVAAHYGIETYSGESVEIVANDPVKERERMVTHGTGKETAENYEEMRINREVREKVNASLTTEGNKSATRQGEFMAQAIVNERREEGTLTPEAEKAPEPTSRTKEIADPSTPQGYQQDTALTPPSDPPPGGELTSSGQAGDQALKDLQELETAKTKTL